MEQLTVMAPAKINLSLDIVGKRSDGYHLLSTVMQSVDLADFVTLRLSSTGSGPVRIVLTCDQAALPLDDTNTAQKAAVLFMSHEALQAFADSGILLEIHLQKNIPVAAGLAGGSTDAAAVLFGLSQLIPNRLSSREVDKIALQTGADVPFCLHGGTMLCEGIGEILTRLPPWKDLSVLLCCPDQPLLTAHVFAAYNESESSDRPETDAVLAAIRNQDLAVLAACTANVLEPVSLNLLPELAIIKKQIMASGAKMAQMSGSGPTVFGLYGSHENCQDAADILRDVLPQIRLFSCRSLAEGPKLLEIQNERWHNRNR
ncbi:MAG: 4-(cytidine 5'-diphospho)-2-C-methyl-D-erythritol kinase [Bacillota bacterium]|nr:4-(cytidine 5'-diphospho)-2-C-methyl-D-erythritol kinase [Bacillota bacterium]